MKKKRHYVYFVKHLPSQCYYIGVRSCYCAPSEDSSYLGSGLDWVELFLKVYPKEQFKKDILLECETREEANEFERFVIDNSHEEDYLCMNRVGGGKTGEWSEEVRKVHREKTQDPEYRKRMSEIMTEKWQDEEFREERSAKRKERWKNRDYRNHMLQLSQDRWSNPEFVTRMTKIFTETRTRNWASFEYRRDFSLKHTATKSGKTVEEVLIDIELVFSCEEQGLSIKDIAEILEKNRDWVRGILLGKSHKEVTKELRKQREIRLSKIKESNDD